MILLLIFVGMQNPWLTAQALNKLTAKQSVKTTEV